MAQNDELKLLGLWVSPFSRRVEWALKIKGVDYEYIEQDVFNKSPLLLELNPITKKVPVLVHNGKVMIESFLLIEYIDETWTQNPLLPQDPYQRAMARFWAKFGEEVMQELFLALLAEGEEKEKRVKTVTEGLEKIETELNGKKWFGGDNVGYLDLALGWISYWLPAWEEVIRSVRFLDPTKFPSIAAWTTSFVNHPVINGGDALPDRDMMIGYFQARVEEIAAGLNYGSNYKYHGQL